MPPPIARHQPPRDRMLTGGKTWVEGKKPPAGAQTRVGQTQELQRVDVAEVVEHAGGNDQVEALAAGNVVADAITKETDSWMSRAGGRNVRRARIEADV